MLITYNFTNTVISFVIIILSIELLLFPSTIKIILLFKDFKDIHKTFRQNLKVSRTKQFVMKHILKKLSGLV